MADALTPEQIELLRKIPSDRWDTWKFYGDDHEALCDAELLESEADAFDTAVSFRRTAKGEELLAQLLYVPYYVDGETVVHRKFTDADELFVETHSKGDAHKIADTLNALYARTAHQPNTGSEAAAIDKAIERLAVNDGFHMSADMGRWRVEHLTSATFQDDYETPVEAILAAALTEEGDRDDA